MSALVVAAIVLLTPHHAEAQPAPAQAAGRLLDVPYITQTRDLCGGAALEMVFRYWGETSVRAADFSPLVEPGRGIHTGELAQAASSRGWTSLVVDDVSEDPRARIREELGRGRPLIALIEVAANTYHYVVIVGATDDVVVFHDPARKPFRAESWNEFDRVWRLAGRWMLLVIPSASPRTGAAVPEAADSADQPMSPCEALVQRSVEQAGAGALEEAERGLRAARAMCPLDAAPVRELAGLRFVQSRWSDAIVLADEALTIDPDDRNARDILGTSLYLSGEAARALEAWAPLGEPVIDAVTVIGAEHIRHPVLVNASGLAAGQQLASADLELARRRIRAVPSLASSQVTYTPTAAGQARVDITVVEREPLPAAPLPVLVALGRAVISESVDVPVSGLLGEGEHLQLRGRWSDERPLVRAAVAVPAPEGVPGVFDALVSWDRQAYGAGSGMVRARRRRVEAGWSHWLTANTRARVSVGNDRFDDTGSFSFGVGADQRLFHDRVAIAVDLHRWWARDDTRFDLAAGAVAWRSTAIRGAAATSAQFTVSAASHNAPLALWPGAGTGPSRRAMLRAHPLLDGDVLAGEVFGRTVVQATVERTQPLPFVPGWQVSLAGFVDTARAWRRLPSKMGASEWLIDAGIGLRVPVGTGVIRLDLAHGLRGGGLAASAGWSVIWPD